MSRQKPPSWVSYHDNKFVKCKSCGRHTFAPDTTTTQAKVKSEFDESGGKCRPCREGWTK